MDVGFRWGVGDVDGKLLTCSPSIEASGLRLGVPANGSIGFGGKLPPRPVTTNSPKRRSLVPFGQT